MNLPVQGVSNLKEIDPLSHMTRFMEIFNCPRCKGDLNTKSSKIICLQCSHPYPIEGEIPLLYTPNEWNPSRNDVTDTIRAFYEETPFPNYDGIEDVGDLIEVSRKGIFARLLNEQMPYNSRVLEIGCGTGQLSNYLSVAHRFVFGADLCLNSLKLAQRFKKQHQLDRVGFYQINLFNPPFKEESFHFVISNGVLHHTSDPYLGFKSISRLVKKGGYILIGLYNRYGRIPTDVRRVLFRAFHNRFKRLDPRLSRKDISDLKKNTWFMDQYQNPHESKHTMEEVLRWFDDTGFEFMSSIPKLGFFEDFSENEQLFEPSTRGNWFTQLLAQLFLIITGNESGGFFLMIGKRIR